MTRTLQNILYFPRLILWFIILCVVGPLLIILLLLAKANKEKISIRRELKETFWNQTIRILCNRWSK